MRDPLIAEIRRARAKLSKELEQDADKAMARWEDLRLKICDVIVTPTGERRYVASAVKMHEVLIAPRLARVAATKIQRRHSTSLRTRRHRNLTES